MKDLTGPKNYKPVKEGEDHWMIAEWDEGYNAYITNDGIYGHYTWPTEQEAQEAADAYNAYEGNSGLDNHGYGYDRISREEADNSDDTELVRLFSLFNAIDDDE